MDGKGRWLDNVFIERLWRTLKYDELHLREFNTLPDLEVILTNWRHRCGRCRPGPGDAKVLVLGALTVTPEVFSDASSGPPLQGICLFRQLPSIVP